MERNLSLSFRSGRNQTNQSFTRHSQRQSNEVSIRSSFIAPQPTPPPPSSSCSTIQKVKVYKYGEEGFVPPPAPGDQKVVPGSAIRAMIELNRKLKVASGVPLLPRTDIEMARNYKYDGTGCDMTLIYKHLVEIHDRINSMDQGNNVTSCLYFNGPLQGPGVIWNASYGEKLKREQEEKDRKEGKKPKKAKVEKYDPYRITPISREPSSNYKPRYWNPPDSPDKNKSSRDYSKPVERCHHSEHCPGPFLNMDDAIDWHRSINMDAFLNDGGPPPLECVDFDDNFFMESGGTNNRQDNMMLPGNLFNPTDNFEDFNFPGGQQQCKRKADTPFKPMVHNIQQVSQYEMMEEYEEEIVDPNNITYAGRDIPPSQNLIAEFLGPKCFKTEPAARYYHVLNDALIKSRDDSLARRTEIAERTGDLSVLDPNRTRKVQLTFDWSEYPFKDMDLIREHRGNKENHNKTN